MSHYVVVVIGEDPDGQLAPFDENTIVAKYCKGEVSDKEKNSFMEYYQKEKPKEAAGKTFDELVEMFGQEWSNWQKDVDGVVRAYSTYNPNSKWDWYSLGGRWTGFFKLKKGAKGELGTRGLGSSTPRKGFADAAKVKDIDFDGMEREHREKAVADYDKVMEVLGKYEPNQPWSVYMKKMSEGGNIDDIRDEYWAQPRCKAFRENEIGLGYFDSPDDYLCTREEYGDLAAANSYTPYAVIKDYEWFAKGEMGWWGMSNDNLTDKEWSLKFREMIRKLPEDTMLWAYDLHI